MRRFAFVLALAAVLVPLRADALTLRDIIELTRAGLGDEVLLALIEVDRPVFSVDPETLKKLKAAGVSERVIVAMVRSGRTPEPAPLEPVEVPEPVPQPEPQVIVIDHHDEEPRVREVPYAVPVYIPVAVRGHDRHRVTERTVGGVRVPADWPIREDVRIEPEPRKAAEPVYWGWGGKRRPDTWEEPHKQREKKK